MMRKIIANLLRRIANKISPEKSWCGLSTEITPLEFMSTSELAEIIRSRNDCCILYWGRDTKSGTLNGEVYWRINADHLEPVMIDIANRIIKNSKGS